MSERSIMYRFIVKCIFLLLFDLIVCVDEQSIELTRRQKKFSPLNSGISNWFQSITVSPIRSNDVTWTNTYRSNTGQHTGSASLEQEVKENSKFTLQLSNRLLISENSEFYSSMQNHPLAGLDPSHNNRFFKLEKKNFDKFSNKFPSIERDSSRSHIFDYFNRYSKKRYKNIGLKNVDKFSANQSDLHAQSDFKSIHSRSRRQTNFHSIDNSKMISSFLDSNKRVYLNKSLEKLEELQNLNQFNKTVYSAILGSAGRSVSQPFFQRFVKEQKLNELDRISNHSIYSPDDENHRGDNKSEEIIGVLFIKKWNQCTVSSADDDLMVCEGANITEIPLDIKNSNLHTLTLIKTSIKVIEARPFKFFKKALRHFYVEGAKYLETIKPDAFKELENLQSVSIKEAPLLITVDPLVLSNCPSQFSLEIIKSGLKEAIPIKHRKDKVKIHLQFDNDKLSKIESNTFQVYVEMMILGLNLIESIEDNAFKDSHIGHLSLRGNRKLNRLSDKAFMNINALNKLDLSDTNIIKLPTIGLRDLEVIRIMNTYSLKFPRKEPEFAAYETFYKSYCLDKVSTTTLSPLSDGFNDREAEWGLPFDIPNTTIPITNHTELLGQNIDQSSNGSNSLQKFFTKTCGRVTQLESNPVNCTPKPDAFNPCEDIMGNNWLRITVWFVLFAALFGNFFVFVILFSGKLPINVSKFLMCNLALADFFMGVYLFIIAAFDLRTMGNYFNYAIDWQHGLGCKIAGFITVFSSELSIYTLTIITMERYFPIAYPLQMDKRLKLSLAIKVMLGGWIYSIAMAALPLPMIGISSYSKTSICLPMETRNKYDIAYLIFILCFSAVDFVLISACYAKMYLSIISQKTRVTTNDMKVAKGMALLVFTDFACFMPITFFGLTAIAGYPLIDVTRSKILLVFFFPLNSMANPFLYTITKQFRRDFHSLASRFSLCTSRAFRFRSMPCAHQAYYRAKHHRHRNYLAAIGSPIPAGSASSSNCQSKPIGYNTNSNNYSPSMSQLSNNMYNESYMNSRSSNDLPNDRGRHGRIHRYYYRNPYPHHHFSVSKQYKDIEPPFETCCNKYNRKDHEKHVHCYHHHKKHTHSAPVSQANESISISQESNFENFSQVNERQANNQVNKNLNLNKYLNTALSTSILYNQNNPNQSSTGSSSTDNCCLAMSSNQMRNVDTNKAYCSRCGVPNRKMQC